MNLRVEPPPGGEAFAEIWQAMVAYEALDPKAGWKARRDALSTLRAQINNATRHVEGAGAFRPTPQPNGTSHELARRAQRRGPRDERSSRQGCDSDARSVTPHRRRIGTTDRCVAQNALPSDK